MSSKRGEQEHSGTAGPCYSLAGDHVRAPVGPASWAKPAVAWRGGRTAPCVIRIWLCVRSGLRRSWSGRGIAIAARTPSARNRWRPCRAMSATRSRSRGASPGLCSASRPRRRSGSPRCSTVTLAVARASGHAASGGAARGGAASGHAASGGAARGREGRARRGQRAAGQPDSRGRDRPRGGRRSAAGSHAGPGCPRGAAGVGPAGRAARPPGRAGHPVGRSAAAAGPAPAG